VLLVGIVFLAIATLLGGGAFGLFAAEDDVEASQIEHELESFDTRTEDVALGNSQQTEVEFNIDAGEDHTYKVDEDAGSIRVEVGGTVVHQSDLGMIISEYHDEKMGYQSGGVFREINRTDYPVQRPPISMEDISTPTYTMPIIQIEGKAAPSGTMVVAHEDTTRAYPARKVNGGDTVKIIIESEFASAWGQALAHRFDLGPSDITVNSNNGRVEAEISHSSDFFVHLVHHRMIVDSS